MAYVENLVAYTNAARATDIAATDLQSFLTDLFNFLVARGWECSISGMYYSFITQQAPWLIDEPTPSYYRGKAKMTIVYNGTLNCLDIVPGDSVDEMKLVVSTIFTPPLRIFPASSFRVIANPYQCFIFAIGNVTNAFILASLQVPKFVATGVQIKDSIVGLDYGFRSSFKINGNCFVGINSVLNGAAYWNASTISGPGIPCLHTMYDGNFLQPVSHPYLTPLLIPAKISWGNSPSFGAPYIRGYFHDAMIWNTNSLPLDNDTMEFDGHIWHVYSSTSIGALLLTYG